MRGPVLRRASAGALALALGCGDDQLDPPPLGLPTDSGTGAATVATAVSEESSTEASSIADGTASSTGSPFSATETGSSTSGTTDAATSTGTSSGSETSSGLETSSGTDASSGTSTSGGPHTSSGTSTPGDTDTGSGTSSSGGTDASGGTSSSSGGSSDTGVTDVCVDVDLGAALGLVTGDTTPLADDRAPPCVAGMGGPDAGHLFVAPTDGFYTFDSAGSSFDTVLHAYTPDCDGTFVGCNDDDALGVLQSRLSLYLGAAQEVVVVLDGWDDTQHGAYDLDVSAVFEACLDDDLGEVLMATTMGDTTAELDKLEPPCLATSGPEAIVRWVAPTNDTYRITTAGSSFDTVLYVLLGECAGPPIACNDDTSAVELTSTVQIAPGAGQEVSIVVDGFDAGELGPFVLSVEPL